MFFTTVLCANASAKKQLDKGAADTEDKDKVLKAPAPGLVSVMHIFCNIYCCSAVSLSH